MSKHSTSQKAGGKTVGKAFFAKALQIAHDGVIALDETQNVLFFNDGAERIFGYTASEVINQPLDMLLPPHLVETHCLHFRNFAASSDTVRKMGERQEVAGRRKDGTIFPATVSIAKVYSDGKITFTAILNDITDQKEAEQRIKNKVQHLAALHAIDVAIAGNLSLNQVLNVVLEQSIAQLGVDAACILLFNPETQTLQYADGLGFRTDSLKFTNLRIGQGYAGLAAQEQRIIHVPNLHGRTTDFLRSPHFSAEGFAATMPRR